MELLLNLAWVLLALPAYWLWRRNGAASPSRSFSPLRCLLILGCTLVLLFPVISATDDLHPMRAEMEDSALSKRTVRQAISDKQSSWVNRLQSPAAVTATAVRLVSPQTQPFESSLIPPAPLARIFVIRAGRAPPLFFLG